ncbi:MAG TPA: hypothetical protein VFW45_11140 [Candidatus Polarisedimenticolia bacterium]|nr:hypothetical protein [Candidatus Polarisedimenticolia bacterium]
MPDVLLDSPGPETRPWSPWQRFLFRYALLHYVLYAFPGPLGALIQTLTGGLELLGAKLDQAPWSWLDNSFVWVDRGWERLTDQMASLGLAPYEVIHQQTGSGDTGAAYAQLLFIVVVSFVGAVIWSLLSKALAYPRLGRWLHLIVRFDLAFTLFGYGLEKFYGGQFGVLSLTRLTQEIGDTWPMTMVGTFMQASKPYELFSGACEVLGGLLLFHRRTALLGACVAIATMTNVCALNWLYGVPVKQYSAHLLLYGVGLLAPFLPQLWAVFIRNRPSQPVDIRVVKDSRAGGVLMALGVAWVAAYLVITHFQGLEPKPWTANRERSALYGLWMVESMLVDGQEVPATDATRWRDFAIDRGSMAWSREFTGKRHYFEFKWDDTTGIAQVKERGSAGDPSPWTCERGLKIVKGDPPLLLHNEDRGKPVDVERRSLVIKGKWDTHDLELHTVEKIFRLQTGFRLRQELPDFW